MMAALGNRDSGLRVENMVRAVMPRAAKIRTTRSNARVDMIINNQPLEIKWIGDGRLVDAMRMLANRRERPDIVVARHLSPGARKVLTDAGIGWVDETGAAEIAKGTIVVSRTGRTLKPTDHPKRWAPSVFAVAEALLCGVKATVAATENATGLSNGSCTTALRALTNFGLLEAQIGRGRYSARQVVNSDHLLDVYASAVDVLPPSISLQCGVTWRNTIAGLTKTGEIWTKAKISWASTGVVAAAIIAPHLMTTNTAVVYVDGETVLDLEAVAVKAELRPIAGGRLTLKPFPTVTARRLAKDVDGMWVVPWPRAYVDVRSIGVRGEDAAEHLREVVRGK